MGDEKIKKIATKKRPREKNGSRTCVQVSGDCSTLADVPLAPTLSRILRTRTRENGTWDGREIDDHFLSAPKRTLSCGRSSLPSPVHIKRRGLRLTRTPRALRIRGHGGVATANFRLVRCAWTVNDPLMRLCATRAQRVLNQEREVKNTNTIPIQGDSDHTNFCACS